MFSIISHTQYPRRTMWTVNYYAASKQPILIALVSGNLAEQLSKRSDKEVCNE